MTRERRDSDTSNDSQASLLSSNGTGGALVAQSPNQVVSAELSVNIVTASLDAIVSNMNKRPSWYSFERFGAVVSFFFATTSAVVAGANAPVPVPAPIFGSVAGAAPVFVIMAEIVIRSCNNRLRKMTLQNAIDAKLKEAESAFKELKLNNEALYNQLVHEYETKVQQPFSVKGALYFLIAATFGFSSLGMTLPGLWDNMESIFQHAKSPLEYFTYYFYAAVNNTAVGIALAQCARFFTPIPGHVLNYLTMMNFTSMNISLVMDEIGKVINQSSMQDWLKIGLTAVTAGAVSGAGALVGAGLYFAGLFRCNKVDRDEVGHGAGMAVALVPASGNSSV